jgi:hypothetical protein
LTASGSLALRTVAPPTRGREVEVDSLTGCNGLKTDMPCIANLSGIGGEPLTSFRQSLLDPVPRRTAHNIVTIQRCF